MKKVIHRAVALAFFCFGLLVIFLLNPILSYAHSTTYKNITIYYNGALDENLTKVIDLSLSSVSNAKIYSADIKSDLCLNEGIYPKIVKTILGDDVFTAFSNKIVVLGEKSSEFNRFHKWEKELKYSQFLSHALMHNLQYKKHGILGANPVGRHPNWRWEGYVEYEILGDLLSLEELVTIIQDPASNDYDWINLTEEEGTVKRHIIYMALVKYGFEILNWDYEQLMGTKIGEEELLNRLISTYSKE